MAAAATRRIAPINPRRVYNIRQARKSRDGNETHGNRQGGFGKDTRMRLTLGTKLVLAMSAIAALAIGTAVATLVFMHATVTALRSTAESLPVLKAAEEVQIALSDQKGLVAMYVLSEGNRPWLEKLSASKTAFDEWMAEARGSALTPDESQILDEIEVYFSDYDARREKAIVQFDRGQPKESVSTIADEVWPAYDRVYDGCEKLIDAADNRIRVATARAQKFSAVATWSVPLGSAIVAGLSVALMWLLVQRVFLPLRRMVTYVGLTVECAPDSSPALLDDEIRSVGSYFRALMADAAETRSALAESRSRLWNAEKLAAVGKLAASVAHEMRNPLSSMKMWLYSIRKTAADPALDHKYQILSDEINRLEGIVRNVLEFSRPPSPKPEPRCIRQVIDQTLEIVRPWLESKRIQVVQDHETGLPQVLADPEQLKQVFVNLLDNAAEAMPGGGEITISTARQRDAHGAPAVTVRVQDTGPGIPEEVQSRLFEPFFTTKDDGTGLGLCIAANILAAQAGQLTLESSSPGGTTFALRLPIAAERSEPTRPTA